MHNFFHPGTGPWSAHQKDAGNEGDNVCTVFRMRVRSVRRLAGYYGQSEQRDTPAVIRVCVTREMIGVDAKLSLSINMQVSAPSDQDADPDPKWTRSLTGLAVAERQRLAT
jgi:hypothetical protein